MLKLLIVDDNDFERNSLANYINWEILGIQLADTAFNGQDAVEKVKLHHPDIIISDIKMPIMDGIEMAKIVRSIFPEIKFIFSSGYDDVALLKEALELRAFNYIIKPVIPDELINTVKKVAAYIIDEKLSKLENNAIIKQYQENLSFLQGKFLESIILKERSADEAAELFSQASNLKLRIIGDYRLVLIDLDFENDDLFDASCQTDVVMGELKNDLSGENVIFLEIETCMIVALIYYLDGKHTQSEKVIASISSSLERSKSSFSFKFSMGVSTTATNLTDLFKLYRQSVAAAGKKIELGFGQVIYFEQLESIYQVSETDNKGSMKDLIAAAVNRVMEGEDFSGEIGRLADLIAAMPGSKLENTKSVMISLFNALSKTMESSGESFEKIADEELAVSRTIISAKTIPDMLQFAGKTLEKIQAFYAKNKTTKDDYIVNEILNILHHEYGQPITLTYLSDRVYLSPNYLRVLFKNKMDISIQDYLTNIRINKAKELLKQNQYKIHEIGEKVGYPNSTYFNMVFKNYVNQTPGEYRSKYLSYESGKPIRQNEP